MASYRRLPRNQYECEYCGGRHRFDSQRGAECARRGTPSTTTWPREHRIAHLGARQPEQRWMRPPEQSADQPWRRRPRPRQARARDRARQALVNRSGEVYQDAVALAFDPERLYTRLADRLLTTLPVHRRRGHWLCRRLDGTANAITPGTYAGKLRDPLRETLLAAGAPAFLAEAFAAVGTYGRNAVVSAALPTGQVTSVLRVLIPLICPNFAACPAREAVLETFGVPLLSDALREFAGRLR
ncbi:hypothetical protein [Sciscionella sediminilitoris]|uniref:hypothetical protein n=1 Tax=Sciscionella sediminilitoris TaxID=1445613 RepID=UPI0012E2008B|nr:hypothetical protein [Sciscionella sp. SE31]